MDDYNPHERGFNPAFENDPAQSELFGVSELAVGIPGTIRAKATRTYRPTDTTAIFRLNKQSRQESLSLAYAAEGVWVVVSTRIRNYAKQLDRAGFPVAFHLNPDKIEKPAITIKISAENDPWAVPDNFVFRLVHLGELCRALNSMVDCLGMHILALFNPLSTVKARDEAYIKELVDAAALLRDIKYVRVHVSAKPALSRLQVTLAPLVLESSGRTPSKTKQSICQSLTSTILEQSDMLSRGDFLEAESMLTETRAMMRDYVLGDSDILIARWLRPGPLIPKPEIDGTLRKKYAAIIALLMRARYELGKHELVVKHCDFIMNDKTIIELPENMLAYTGVHYYRGMSHLALRNYDLAISDLRQCLASAPPLSLNMDNSLFPILDYKSLALMELGRIVE